MQDVIEIINTIRQKIDKLDMQFDTPYLEQCEGRLYIRLDSGDDSEDLPYSGVTFIVDTEEYLKKVNEDAVQYLKKELKIE